MVDFPCLYARFDPAVALDADDPVYVDWQEELGLTDVKLQLANCVQLTTTGYSHRLVTGLRGGGKTTELRRVKRALEEGPLGQRYFVSFLDADDTLDLDDADPTDLVLAIVARLIADLRAAGIEVKAGKRLKSFLSAAQEILASVPEAGVDITLADPLGIAKLSTTLKRQPSVRKRVRDLLEGRNLDTLYDAINEEVLPPVRDQLGRDDYAGVLVVVDQLDRIPPEDDRHHKLFWEGRGQAHRARLPRALHGADRVRLQPRFPAPRSGVRGDPRASAAARHGGRSGAAPQRDRADAPDRGAAHRGLRDDDARALRGPARAGRARRAVGRASAHAVSARPHGDRAQRPQRAADAERT